MTGSKIIVLASPLFAGNCDSNITPKAILLLVVVFKSIKSDEELGSRLIVKVLWLEPAPVVNSLKYHL